MTDIELEEKIRKIREKDIADINMDAYSNFNENARKQFYNKEVETINTIVDSVHFRRLIKAGVIENCDDYINFKISQSPNWGTKYDSRKLSNSDVFMVPYVNDPEFTSYLVVDEEAKTVGILCQSNRPSDQKVLIHASTFYYNMEFIKDVEGNYHRSEVIGEGMENLGSNIKAANAGWNRNNPPSKIDHMKAKIMKFCELAGGRRFKVNIKEINYHDTNAKLVSTTIYKYHLVE